MRLLIDGDVIVYRAGFAAESVEYGVHYDDHEYDEEVTRWFPKAKAAKEFMASLPEESRPQIEKRVTPEDVRNARYNVSTIIQTCLDDLCATREEVTVFLTGKGNFREEVATILPYKGNRVDNTKPIHTDAIKEYMKHAYDTVVVEGQEADDAMSIAQWEALRSGEDDTVICTIDKDLDMVPGMHFNFVTRESYYVDPEVAHVYFWRQMLTGDSTDNIPGIRGIGKKTAEKMIPWEASEIECYNVVRKTYEQHYEDKADDALLEVGRLLWMRSRENELWTPPKQ
jgi:hypothetical protein